MTDVLMVLVAVVIVQLMSVVVILMISTRQSSLAAKLDTLSVLGAETAGAVSGTAKRLATLDNYVYVELTDRVRGAQPALNRLIDDSGSIQDRQIRQGMTLEAIEEVLSPLKRAFEEPGQITVVDSKPESESETEIEQILAAKPVSRRGRPAGSKNKSATPITPKKKARSRS